MGNLRAFAALYPDDPAHRALVAFRDELRRACPREGFRWAKDDQLHLTLRFMGELPEEDAEALIPRLADAVSRFPRMRLSASWVGEPWKGARVVAAKVKSDGPGLVELQKSVENAVRSTGLPPEGKPFNPHLTFARIDHPRLQPRTRPRVVAAWEATELVLVKSVLGVRGATHGVMARFPLQ